MWRASMFENENTLPRSELHSSIHNGYCLTGAGQRHPDMRWHIIAALGTVREVVCIFGHQPVEELFEIAARCRIGIFHDQKTATGVLNKQSAGPALHSIPIDLRLHIIGDFVQAFTSRAQFEFFVMDLHQSPDY